MSRNALFGSATINFMRERVDRGLAVEGMAELVGVAPHVWRHLERGGIPLPENQFKIAKFFDRRVSDVWPVNTTNGKV